jgi:large subunit ribosomal protein L14
MVNNSSVVRVVDNCGALLARCIAILGGSKRRKAAVPGTSVVVVILSVNKYVRLSKKKRKVRVHGISKALVVRTNVNVLRKNGMFVHFDNNDVILLNWNNTPRGSRIVGPIPYELREYRVMKFISISHGTI